MMEYEYTDNDGVVSMDYEYTDNDQDYISDLPESVITHILSRLDTREAVRTCILSKDWRYKWTSIYNVTLSDRRSKGMKRFVGVMERMILVCLSHNIKAFGLSCGRRKYNCSIMTKLISAVLGPNIEKLSWHYLDEGFVLPHSLLDCASLEEMFLGPSTLRVRAVNKFPKLRKLVFSSCVILNEGTDTDPLILQFPVLKQLIIRRCKWSMKLVEIHAPQLTEFQWRTDDNTALDDNTIKIVGARLAKFEFHGSIRINFVLTGTSVDYAHLEGHPGVTRLQVRKLLKELSTIKQVFIKLDMMDGFYQPYSGLHLPMYERLERLDIENPYLTSGVLVELLHAAPTLKYLGVGPGRGRDDFDYDMVNYIPTCIISCLEEVKFAYDYLTQPQFRLEKYLLKNGAQLKKVFLQFICTGVRVRFVEQLSSFPKASTDLTIVVDR